MVSAIERGMNDTLIDPATKATAAQRRAADYSNSARWYHAAYLLHGSQCSLGLAKAWAASAAEEYAYARKCMGVE